MKGLLCQILHSGFYLILSSLDNFYLIIWTYALRKAPTRILHHFFRISILSFLANCLLPTLLYTTLVMLTHSFWIVMSPFTFAMIASFTSSPQYVIKKSTVSIFLTSLTVFLTNVKNSSVTRHNPPQLAPSIHDFVYSKRDIGNGLLLIPNAWVASIKQIH